jgi:hypothetical protein
VKREKKRFFFWMKKKKKNVFSLFNLAEEKKQNPLRTATRRSREAGAELLKLRRGRRRHVAGAAARERRVVRAQSQLTTRLWCVCVCVGAVFSSFVSLSLSLFLSPWSLARSLRVGTTALAPRSRRTEEE